MKGEQLASVLTQLADKDEQHAIVRTQLADKDVQQRQDRMHWCNRFDGHLTNLLDTHQSTILQAQNATREHITQQLAGMGCRFTRQPKTR